MTRLNTPTAQLPPDATLPRTSGGAGLGAAGVAISAAGSAVNVLAYAVPLLAARRLQPESVGALATALALSVIATVPGIGLQAALAVSRARDGVVINARRITLITAAIAAGSLLLIFPLETMALRLSADLPIILSATTVAVVFAGRHLGELQGSQRFGRLAVGMALVGLGRHGAVIAGLTAGAGVSGSLAAGACASWLVVPVVALLARPSPAGAAALVRESSDPIGSALSGRAVAAASGATLAMIAISYADLILARYVLPAGTAGQYAVGATLMKVALWAPQFVTVLALPLIARGSRPAILWPIALVGATGVGFVLAANAASDLAVGVVGGALYSGLGQFAAWFAAIGALYALIFVLVNAEIGSAVKWPAAQLWLGLAGLVGTALLLRPQTIGAMLTISVSVAGGTAIVSLLLMAWRSGRLLRIDRSGADVRLRDGLVQTSRDWTRLGESDPLWAVMTLPGKRGGQWDVDDFLATGADDVSHTMNWLGRLGLPTNYGRVLDFGCGVGRLSQALAHHADHVIGVDISAPMLETARRMDRSDGKCVYLRNDAPDLSDFPDHSFDLVYCALVLQHLPRTAVDRFIAEFLRVLRPGGVAVIQVPTRPLRTAKGLVWMFVPFRLIAWGQRRVLGYPAPMRMTAMSQVNVEQLVARAGGKVASSMVDPTYTEDWLNTRYALQRL